MCYTFPSTPYQIEIKIRFATWGLLKGEPLPSLCSASAATPGKCRWKKFFFFRSLCGLCGLCGLLEIFISVFESARGRGGVKLPEVLPIPEKRGKLLLEAKKIGRCFPENDVSRVLGLLRLTLDRNKVTTYQLSKFSHLNGCLRLLMVVVVT